MRLCFGIFANVLNYCRLNNIRQDALVARIVKCVDQHSSYIVGSDKFYNENVLEISGDGPAVSKLLHCTRNFVFVDRNAAVKPAIENVINNFDTNVSPFIIENMKGSVILALLDIIRQDETIDFTNRDSFKEYLGLDKQHLLQQEEFNFSDFLGRILVYTTYGNIENTLGKEYVHLLTKDYINKVTALYIYDYIWNRSTQTLVSTFVGNYLRFNKVIQRYLINKFVEEIDPTVKMDYIWVERCENFLKDIESEIYIPFAANGSTTLAMTIIHKVQEFAQALDDYATYLGQNMRPIEERPDIFIPFYRDENMGWYRSFITKVRDYRQRLISIYQEIYSYAESAKSHVPE